jgi:hypothetical protein
MVGRRTPLDATMLPKLFFVHVRDTSFVAEDGGELSAFLCGFRSQTYDGRGETRVLLVKTLRH